MTARARKISCLSAIVALAVLGLLLLAFGDPAWPPDLLPDYVFLVVPGTLFGQTSLAAAWCALGPFSLARRLALSSVWLAALVIALGLNRAIEPVARDVDDLLTFGAAQKMALQFAAAALAVGLGAPIPSVTGVAALDVAFAVFWIVGVVNAVNVIDVCDGLAASVCFVTFAAFAMALSPYPVVAAALAGSCLGFLVWNRPKARIFMGDAGSLFLGFFVAALSLTATAPARPGPFAAMLALFAGVPLFDLAFQSITRAREGRAWYIGGPDSFALRLQEAGLSKAAVDVTASVVALALWVCAYAMPRLALVSQVVLIAGLAVTAALVWRSLLHWKVRMEPKPAAGLDR